MSWVDIGLLVVLASFTANGVMQGMMRQVIGLVSVLAALLVAGRYHAPLGRWLSAVSAWRPMAAPAAYAILLLGTWILVNLIGFATWREPQHHQDRWADTLAGGLLGLLKGIVLLSAIVWGAVALGLEPGMHIAQTSIIMRWLFRLTGLLISAR